MSALNPANLSDIQLCSALGNANSTPPDPRPAGVFVLYVWGTIVSAKLQVSPDNGTTWVDYPGASFNSAGISAPVYLGRDNLCRIASTGGSVNATLSPVS